MTSNYARQQSGSTPYNTHIRSGRGGNHNNHRGRFHRGGGGGYNRGGGPSYRGGFTYRGRSSNKNFHHYSRGGYASNATPHGDMKTGLYKDSFLEDPWKELIYSRQKQARPAAAEGDGEEGMMGGDDEDEEGEILLPDDDDDDDGGGRVGEGWTGESVGLGDGLVEAVKGVS